MSPGTIALLQLSERHPRPVRRCLDGQKARILSVEGSEIKVSLLHDPSRTFSVRQEDIVRVENESDPGTTPEGATPDAMAVKRA